MHSAYSGQLPGRQVFLDQQMGGALVLQLQIQIKIKDQTSSDEWGSSTFVTYFQVFQVFLDQEMGGALVLFKQNQDLANGGDTRFHILDQHIIGKAVVPQIQIQDLTSSETGTSTYATYTQSCIERCMQSLIQFQHINGTNPTLHSPRLSIVVAGNFVRKTFFYL